MATEQYIPTESGATTDVSTHMAPKNTITTTDVEIPITITQNNQGWKDVLYFRDIS